MRTRTVTRKTVEQILTIGLGLKEPRFRIKKIGGKLSGSVIDDCFDGLGAFQRQRRIWDALEHDLGSSASDVVGTLLAYTNEEWDMPLEGLKKPRRRKAG